MPRLAFAPQDYGLTRYEARCVEALSYLAPGNPAGTGGWQSLMYLGLWEHATEEDLRRLERRGCVEGRTAPPRTQRGERGGGRVRLWRLTPRGWALARECGWPAWDEGAEGVL
jgi:hypothetical protein